MTDYALITLVPRMRGSRKFRQGGGGGPGQSDKKSSDNVFFLCFFSPQFIFTEVKWSISKKSIIFQGFRGGPTFSRGGGGGGGGVQLSPVAYSL